MKKLLTAVLLTFALTTTVSADTKLGLPSPNNNCFHYQVMETGETRVESNRAGDYDQSDVGGHTFSKVKGLVPFIEKDKIKGFSFKGKPTKEILNAWHKLCD